MLDEIIEVYNTFLTATMIATIPLEDRFPYNSELLKDNN
jgi:hypothetical protein